jgi:hypothetical protein
VLLIIVPLFAEPGWTCHKLPDEICMLKPHFGDDPRKMIVKQFPDPQNISSVVLEEE